MKATHKGECQFCEKVQKLPNGRIAKHGYTVVDSVFANTCLGSELLPYNQSRKEITTQLIPAVQNIVTKLQTRIKDIETETRFCYDKIYYPEIRVYCWTKGEILERANAGDTSWTGKQFEFLVDDKFKPVPYHVLYHVLFDMEFPTVETVVRYFNQKYIKHLQAQLAECERTLIRFQNRVETWEEKPLTAI